MLLRKEQKWAEESIEQCHGGGESVFTVLEHRLHELAAGVGHMKDLLTEMQQHIEVQSLREHSIAAWHAKTRL